MKKIRASRLILWIAMILSSILLFSYYYKKNSDPDFETATYCYYNEEYKKSFDLFFPLAEKGHSQSQFFIGEMYYEGKGISKDYKIAFQWLKKSAAKNDPSAQYLLSKMYTTGNGVKKDPKLAAKLVVQSANSGYKPALIYMGIAFWKKGKHQVAHKYFKKAKLTDKQINDLIKKIKPYYPLRSY